MRLFCRQDHTPKDYRQELVEARAELASLELLPPSAFTIPGTAPPYTLRHGVDEKPKRIAYKKAEIARLEVLLNPSNTEAKD